MASPAATTSASTLAKVPLWGRFVIGFGFALLVGAVYWIAFFSDVSNKIEQQTSMRTQLDDKYKAAKRAEETYLSDRSELDVRLENAKQWVQVAPPDVQQGAFLSYVQMAANTSGVKIMSFEPRPEKAETFFVKDPMAVTVEGKFHQIAAFTYEIGKQPRVINLENIELRDPRVEGEDLILTGRCLATAFHTPPNKQAVAAAPGQPAPQPPPPGAPK